jgi:hypothetical protein
MSGSECVFSEATQTCGCVSTGNDDDVDLLAVIGVPLLVTALMFLVILLAGPSTEGGMKHKITNYT